MPRDFTLESQLDKAVEALRRDLSYLMAECSKGKLSPSSARDLVAYIKLLSELKEDEAAFLAGLTEEQLKAIADESSKSANGPERT